MDDKLDIPLHGIAVNIVRRCGPDLSDVLQSKFGCVATIDGVGFEGDTSVAQQRKPTVVPEQRFAVKLLAGVRVSVWKADLTNFPTAEAVVNAANEHLNHCGGLALALSKAGGPLIQKESYDFISKHGVLRTGEAIIGGAGYLPYKNIIHAVGPYLSTYPSTPDVSRAEPLLERAIISILDRVKENQLNTVAIPAISSGLFNYPLRQCADTIVRTVKRYYENYQRHRPQEIFLVNNDEPTVTEMERACCQILSPDLSMTYSQAAGSKSRGDASTATVQLGNVHLTLKWGKIEEQKTDVIVNTTFDKNLRGGQISKAVLQRAGYEIQQEMNRASMTGSIMITKSYKLHCKEVYHTFCFEKGQQAAQQILFNSVSDCLRSASSNHKSIAFPAIGTGGLGFNKKEVAQIMSDAVVDFAQKFPVKMDVYFVIFPSDNNTFKAFEEQMRHLQRKVSHSSFPPAFEHKNDFHGGGAPTPQISLSGPSNEATREAELWLSSVLYPSSNTAIICNNFILHFGEQEHQQLSHLMRKGVSIVETFEKGQASITVNGGSTEDVVVARLQVEAILCHIQREFAREEECAAASLLMLTKNVSFERKTVDHTSPEFSERLPAFNKQGLQMLKMDKVENSTLGMLFDFKKKQLHCSTPQKMFQLISVQFSEMVSHIGFHAEYAPPKDAAYGEGIYFAKTVAKAMEVWRQPHKEYLHFVEAEVLTGNSTSGKPGLILPPAAVGAEAQSLYDSVGGPGVSVIFSGYQALPKYIITCKKF